MARFEIDGLDEIIDQMKRMGQLTGKVAEAMLAAGAEQSKRVWVSIAESYPLRRSGRMIESIGYGKVKQGGDESSIEIYPRGKDATGKSNAMKGFVVQYREGTEGSGWVDTVHEYEGQYIENAMTSVWNEFMATGNVPNAIYPKVSRTSNNGTRISTTTGGAVMQKASSRERARNRKKQRKPYTWES